MKCLYCGKDFTLKNGHTLHQKSCKLNPNRVAGKNQWSLEDYKIRDETREKLSECSRIRALMWNDESKKLHSIRMKLVVDQHPESYTSSNRGRTKQIIYNGIKFQGQWELDFYKWCECKNIDIERSTEWFEYNWNGIRKYNPDFYIPSLDLYVEVKGYETDRDRAKWSQFPKKLRIIKQREITEIRKGCFVGL